MPDFFFKICCYHSVANFVHACLKRVYVTKMTSKFLLIFRTTTEFYTNARLAQKLLQFHIICTYVLLGLHYFEKN